MPVISRKVSMPAVDGTVDEAVDNPATLGETGGVLWTSWGPRKNLEKGFLRLLRRTRAGDRNLPRRQ